MPAALRDELVTLTCDLMRFESVAERPDQLEAVISYVTAYLADLPDLALERSAVGGKHALVVALRPTRTPALMLNGHLDVVVGRPAQFTPEVRDGRIYGRGSQDMKGSCAVMLRLLRDLAARPTRPDVAFQFVTDEEIGGALGTARLLTEGWRGGLLLCLEPTDMGVLYEHKGALWVEVRLPGRPAHGSRPWDGHNPVGDMARGLAALDARFPVPTGPDEWCTTVTPTIIHVGAGSRNQVPPEAVLTLDIRYAADETPTTIMDALTVCFPTAVVQAIAGGPGLRTDPAHPEVSRVAVALTARLGHTPRFFREHYATDARYYTHVGLPAICVGPVGAGLHSDEEWVDINSLVDLYHVLMDYTN